MNPDLAQQYMFEWKTNSKYKYNQEIQYCVWRIMSGKPQMYLLYMQARDVNR